MKYADIILEGDPRSSVDQHSPPILPEDYRNEYLSCIPKIPIPSGRFVFYMRAPEEVVERLLADERVQPQIIARSWAELFFGGYPYWDYVFDVDVREFRDGKEQTTNGKLARNFDGEIIRIGVPGVFAGDAVPEFGVPKFVLEKYRQLRRDTQIIVPTLDFVSTSLIGRVQKDPDALYKIRPREFEELVRELLLRMGWDVDLTPESKDGGYDIYGVSGTTGGLKTSWLIECKRYSRDRKVGVAVARALIGVKEEVKAANAMIVTTSTFTKGVVDISNRRWDLTLADQEKVLEWARQC